MWICLNDAFLSIAVDPNDPAMRVVRAQIESHITKLFPDAEVVETPRGDYRFRALVQADAIAGALGNAVRNIQYTNLEDSVRDNRLHHAYRDVSAVMHRLQPPAPSR